MIEIVSAGERIKYYRKLLNMTQKELVDNKISLNLISLLENDKRKLTACTASILVNNFIKSAEEKGIALELSIKDFLISDEEYLRETFSKEIYKVDTSQFDKEKYMELFYRARRYGLYDVEVTILQKIGDHYYNTGNYIECIKYLQDALKIKIDDKVISINILNRIGTSYYKLYNFNNAKINLIAAKEKLMNIKSSDYEVKYKVLFNLALCCNGVGEFKESVKYLEEILSIEEIEKSKKDKVILLKSNILLRIGDYMEALKLYEYLDDQQIDDMYIVYNNMAIALNKLGQVEKSLTYMNKSISLQLKKLSPNTTISLMQAGDMHRQQSMYNEANVYYNYALKNSCEFKQLEEEVECYKKLYCICESMGRLEQFQEYLDKIIDIMENNINNEKILNECLLLVLDYYMKTQQTKKAENLVTDLKIKRRNNNVR